MPTATTELSSSAAVPFKANGVVQYLSTSSSTAATLRSLYPRAARAFLQRNVLLTHSLLISAFSVLHPPSTSVSDPLAEHRRKWDILRITLETTLYASPPATEDPEALPASLRANLMVSAPSLLTSLHARSLQLFTPSAAAQKPNSAYLPSQILITLSLASLKLDCPEAGRGMIEDWLARRGHVDDIPEDPLSYEKVLDLYCLHVLPRLQEWEYAEDFLADSSAAYATNMVRAVEYRICQQFVHQLMDEPLTDAIALVLSTIVRGGCIVTLVLSHDRNLHLSDMLRYIWLLELNVSHQRIVTVLKVIHAEAEAARRPPPPMSVSDTPSSADSRAVSPAPSSSSSASSTSTHTATPLSPRPRNAKGTLGARLQPITPLSPSPSPSISSDSSQSISSAATSRTVTPSIVQRSNSSAQPRRRLAKSASPSAPRIGNDNATPLPRPPRALPLEASSPSAPSMLSLVRSYIGLYLSATSRSKLTTFLFVVLILPLLSFVFRVRRRRLTAGTGTAEEVRRRLRAAQGGPGVRAAVNRVWEEMVRVIGDTVRMGGRGLV